MSETTHGISIGMERLNNQFFLTLKAVGKLSHSDYQAVLPVIEGALAEVKEPKVKALFDATEMEGWEARAAWDDFRFGLKHGNEFEKIAIYGNKKWQERMAKLGSWFVSGEVSFFESRAEALTWLNM